MINLLYHNYYYRFGEARKQVRERIISGDISGAGIILNQFLTENEDYINRNQVPLDTDNIGKMDVFSLRHAKRHLEPKIVVSGQPPFLLPVTEAHKQAAINALNEPYLEQ